jgi:ribonuclease BN (tRNA processing enzyme)
MDLTVLGSGTVAPERDRTPAAYWVDTTSVQLLLDCGSGTLNRAVTFGIPWADATHVAVTHFHVDHWGELPLFLFALRWGIEPPRADPLIVIGPRGLRSRLTMLAEAYGAWVTAPEFGIEIVELEPGAHLELAPHVELEAFKTPHTDESVAYAVQDGTARLVYTGDTGFDETLADWASGCNLMLAECSLPDDRKIEGHLTPSLAGKLAQRADTRRLVLTHFYPVFGDVDPAALAAVHYAGDVTAARDGDRFSL